MKRGKLSGIGRLLEIDRQIRAFVMSPGVSRLERVKVKNSQSHRDEYEDESSLNLKTGQVLCG